MEISNMNRGTEKWVFLLIIGKEVGSTVIYLGIIPKI